ncbi:MAG TPA: M56 family metallopeptidase [Streptosporangiaceae bacterium]|jgi:hypothetical protein
MMLLALIPLAVSALLAAGGEGLSRRLTPRLAAVLLTALALVISLSTGAVLCLAAVSALARLPVIAAAGGWSLRTARPLEQLPVSWSALAGAVAAVLLALAFGYLARTARELVRASRVCRRLAVGQGRLVITRDERPTAYTVPAGPAAIIVSTGMLRLLTAAERRALLAHEAAHLRYRHAGYVLLARLAAAANPLLRPLADQVRLAVELWADQVAADEVGDRQVVATAVARASLAAARPARRQQAALTIADTHVQARVRALTGPPPRRRRWAAAAALTMILASGSAAFTLAADTHEQVELAQFDYVRSLEAAHVSCARPGSPASLPASLGGRPQAGHDHAAAGCHSISS